MRRGAVLAAPVAALALAFPAAAHGPETPAGVSVLFQSFEPPQITVLAGDPVTWTNTSTREHTVTARDRSFDSGRIQPQGTYVQRFAAPAAYPYLCTIHLTMSGVVDARALLLKGPSGILPSGSRVELEGRAVPGIASVTIQEDRGSGFRPIASAAVAGGRFHAELRPRVTATYRAVAGPQVSPSVRVLVGRPLALGARLRRKTARVTVRTLPPEPGAPVVLQVYLRERFGWWPVARRRLDRSSRARFTVRRRSRGRRIRVVLTEPDGVTVRAVSNVVRIRRVRR